jgi:hypothetical protein
MDMELDMCKSGAKELGYRPFNMEQAKAGAPVMTRDWEEVVIHTYDRKLLSNVTKDEFCIVGETIDSCGCTTWTAEGEIDPTHPHHSRDLVMAPLLHLAGKPAFYGDKLYVKNIEWKEISVDMFTRDLYNLSSLFFEKPQEGFVTREDMEQIFVNPKQKDLYYHTMLGNKLVDYLFRQGKIAKITSIQHDPRTTYDGGVTRVKADFMHEGQRFCMVDMLLI